MFLLPLSVFQTINSVKTAPNLTAVSPQNDNVAELYTEIRELQKKVQNSKEIIIDIYSSKS